MYPCRTRPLLSTRQNFESWQEAGSQDIAARANQTWKQLLNEYQQPALDPATEEALVAYADQRRPTLLAAAS